MGVVGGLPQAGAIAPSDGPARALVSRLAARRQRQDARPRVRRRVHRARFPRRPDDAQRRRAHPHRRVRARHSGRARVARVHRRLGFRARRRPPRADGVDRARHRLRDRHRRDRRDGGRNSTTERVHLAGVDKSGALVLAAGAGAVCAETARNAVEWTQARWSARGPIARLLVDIGTADDLAPFVAARARSSRSHRSEASRSRSRRTVGSARASLSARASGSSPRCCSAARKATRFGARSSARSCSRWARRRGSVSARSSSRS